MASTIDYQKIYDRYQTEGLPRQMSIVKFCEQNGVPYKQYEHWYKKCRGGRTVPVEIVVPEESGAEDRIRSGNSDISQAPLPAGVKRRIRKMEIVFTDGMRLRSTNLDYTLLMETVQRLSSLC